MVLNGRFTLRNRRIEYERRIARSENRSPTITLRGFAIKNRLRTNVPSLRAVGRQPLPWDYFRVARHSPAIVAMKPWYFQNGTELAIAFSVYRRNLSRGITRGT